MNILNHVRAYGFLFGVLKHQQQADPYCGACSAWNNTLNNTREALARLEQEQAAELAALPDASRLLAAARAGLAGLVGPENPAGQKKAGNCKLPEGVCFIKASLALLQKV